MSSKIIAGTTSGTALNMSADTSGQLEIQTGATPTTAITVTSAQNVGIGTTSPSQLLELSSASNPCVMMTDTTNTVKAYMFAGNLAAYMGSATNHPTVFQVNDSEKMRIDTSGNVGIGTSAVPNNAANRGNLTVNGASTSIIQLSVGGTTTAGAYNYFDGTNLNIASIPASGAITFGTNSATERMRIDSSGVSHFGGISTFSDSSIISYANGRGWAAKFHRPNNGNMVEFLNNASTAGSISVSGTSTSYNSSSDYRLKENIAPMQGALNTVAQLKPVTYTWKSSGEATQGFIAHELQAVVPEAVVGEKDAVDTEGNPIYQGIDTSFLVATLTAAIQELNAKVEAQAAEIQVLKGKA